MLHYWTLVGGNYNTSQQVHFGHLGVWCAVNRNQLNQDQAWIWTLSSHDHLLYVVAFKSNYTLVQTLIELPSSLTYSNDFHHDQLHHAHHLEVHVL